MEYGQGSGLVTVAASSTNTGEITFAQKVLIRGIFLGATSRSLLVKVKVGSRYIWGTQPLLVSSYGTAGAVFLAFPAGVLCGPGQPIGLEYEDTSTAENKVYATAVGGIVE